MDPQGWRAVVEGSGVRGAPRMVLGYLASLAEVCVATASLREVVTFSGYSETHAIRALRELRRTENAVWLEESEAFARDGSRRYHLPRACTGSACVRFRTLQAGEYSGSYEGESPAVSLRGGGPPRAVERNKKRMPSTRVIEDAEGCCLCRGTGWKLVPRWRVGMTGNGDVVVRCRAHVKQLALLEVPAVSWAPAITREVLDWRSWQLKASA